MKKLLILFLFTSCISIDQTEPIKKSSVYVSGYSDKEIIDTIPYEWKNDTIKVYIQLKTK